jgi:hypothetical protein
MGLQKMLVYPAQVKKREGILSMKSESELLMPFRITRAFTYQFFGQGEAINLVDYDEVGYGHVEKNTAIISAPTYSRTKMGYDFHAFERVILNKTPAGCSMNLTWTNEAKKITHYLNFIESQEIVSSRPFMLTDNSVGILPNKYRVKKVHCEFDKTAIWGICEFETFIPILRNGVMVDEVFSLTSFEIDAQVLQFEVTEP